MPLTTRQQFVDLLRPLDEFWSEIHGDHEDGYPGNCPQCAILSLLENIGLLVNNVVDWDDEG